MSRPHNRPTDVAITASLPGTECINPQCPLAKVLRKAGRLCTSCMIQLDQDQPDYDGWWED